MNDEKSKDKHYFPQWIPVEEIKDGEKIYGVIWREDKKVVLALKEFECSDHKPVQHRDSKPPWCNTCGLTDSGHKP